MDIFITLIVIIVAINLINSFLRVLKRGSASRAENSTLPVSEPLFEQQASQRITDPYRLGTVSPEKSIEYSSERSPIKEQPVGVESDQPDHEEYSGEVVAKSGRQSPLAANLQHMLTSKEPLVTAFVFHEILEPPLALRRRHKK